MFSDVKLDFERVDLLFEAETGNDGIRNTPSSLFRVLDLEVEAENLDVGVVLDLDVDLELNRSTDFTLLPDKFEADLVGVESLLFVTEVTFSTTGVDLIGVSISTTGVLDAGSGLIKEQYR